MIRRCDARDFDVIWEIINDGATAYKGAIPADHWSDPYMSRNQLKDEIDYGVAFWGFQEEFELMGVMGIQRVQDVTLIRHAYIRTRGQKHGIGTRLLSHLTQLTMGPILIGTWMDATWAIRFYQKNGFQLVAPEQKEMLLKRYWTVPDSQAAISVVLADSKWRRLNSDL